MGYGRESRRQEEMRGEREGNERVVLLTKSRLPSLGRSSRVLILVVFLFKTDRVAL